MADFGWSYPPGCSGPPEESGPPPESEEVREILEKAGVDESTIEQVCDIVENLCIRADKECTVCLDRWAKEELQAQQDLEKYWEDQEKHFNKGK